MCKGDLPRKRERCHLGQEGTQSQSGDVGVGRDVGRGQWPERQLRQQLMSGSENKPSRHTRTEQTCLPVTGRASPPCPAVALTETTAFNPAPPDSLKLWFPR